MRYFWSVVLCLGFSFSSAEAATLRVLSYNVWGAPVAGKNADSRIPPIGRELPQLGADIVAIQEAFEGCLVSNQPAMILRGSKYPFYVKGPAAQGMKCVNSGVMILSKFPIQETAKLVYSSCSGMDCYSRKGMVYARIRVPVIGEIDVYATHTNAEAAGTEIRIAQVKQIVRFVNQHSGDGLRPVLLMGDLNATPDATEIRMLMYKLNLRDLQPEFVSGRDVSQVEKDGYTADPLRNLNLVGRSEHRPKRIDYILFREAAATVVPSQVTDFGLIFQEPKFQKRQLSDHFGIQSTLEIH